MVREISADAFCKIVNNFALEYRATRNAILQQREKDLDREKEKGNEEGKPKEGSTFARTKALQSLPQVRKTCNKLMVTTLMENLNKLAQ